MALKYGYFLEYLVSLRATPTSILLLENWHELKCPHHFRKHDNRKKSI
jgi:hypothetical protein